MLRVAGWLGCLICVGSVGAFFAVALQSLYLAALYLLLEIIFACAIYPAHVRRLSIAPELHRPPGHRGEGFLAAILQQMEFYVQAFAKRLEEVDGEQLRPLGNVSLEQCCEGGACLTPCVDIHTSSQPTLSLRPCRHRALSSAMVSWCTTQRHQGGQLGVIDQLRLFLLHAVSHRQLSSSTLLTIQRQKFFAVLAHDQRHV